MFLQDPLRASNHQVCSMLSLMKDFYQLQKKTIVDFEKYEFNLDLNSLPRDNPYIQINEPFAEDNPACPRSVDGEPCLLSVAHPPVTLAPQLKQLVQPWLSNKTAWNNAEKSNADLRWYRYRVSVFNMPQILPLDSRILDDAAVSQFAANLNCIYRALQLKSGKVVSLKNAALYKLKHDKSFFAKAAEYSDDCLVESQPLKISTTTWEFYVLHEDELYRLEQLRKILQDFQSKMPEKIDSPLRGGLISALNDVQMQRIERTELATVEEEIKQLLAMREQWLPQRKIELEAEKYYVLLEKQLHVIERSNTPLELVVGSGVLNFRPSLASAISQTDDVLYGEDDESQNTYDAEYNAEGKRSVSSGRKFKAQTKGSDDIFHPIFLRRVRIEQDVYTDLGRISIFNHAEKCELYAPALVSFQCNYKDLEDEYTASDLYPWGGDKIGLLVRHFANILGSSCHLREDGKFSTNPSLTYDLANTYASSNTIASELCLMPVLFLRPKVVALSEAIELMIKFIEAEDPSTLQKEQQSRVPIVMRDLVSQTSLSTFSAQSNAQGNVNSCHTQENLNSIQSPRNLNFYNAQGNYAQNVDGNYAQSTESNFAQYTQSPEQWRGGANTQSKELLAQGNAANTQGASALDYRFVPAYTTEQIQGMVNEINRLDGVSEYIYLTKEANSEQLCIAENIERGDAVLVQGPPGTGKTHTIANLLGHFLTVGKTVLVISENSKALTVLKDKVDARLRDLCISILDESNKDSLEALQGIITKYSEFEENRQQYEHQVCKCRDERFSISQRLIQLRQKLLEQQSLENGVFYYQGQAHSVSEISQYIVEHEADWSPLLPSIAHDLGACPLNEQELKLLYKLNEQITPEIESQLQEVKPAPSLLKCHQWFANKVHTLNVNQVCFNSVWSDLQSKLSAWHAPYTISYDGSRLYWNRCEVSGSLGQSQSATASDAKPDVLQSLGLIESPDTRAQHTQSLNIDLDLLHGMHGDLTAAEWMNDSLNWHPESLKSWDIRAMILGLLFWQYTTKITAQTSQIYQSAPTSQITQSSQLIPNSQFDATQAVSAQTMSYQGTVQTTRTLPSMQTSRNLPCMLLDVESKDVAVQQRLQNALKERECFIELVHKLENYATSKSQFALERGAVHFKLLSSFDANDTQSASAGAGNNASSHAEFTSGASFASSFVSFDSLAVSSTSSTSFVSSVPSASSVASVSHAVLVNTVAIEDRPLTDCNFVNELRRLLEFLKDVLPSEDGQSGGFFKNLFKSKGHKEKEALANMLHIVGSQEERQIATRQECTIALEWLDLQLKRIESQKAWNTFFVPLGVTEFSNLVNDNLSSEQIALRFCEKWQHQMLWAEQNLGPWLEKLDNLGLALEYFYVPHIQRSLEEEFKGLMEACSMHVPLLLNTARSLAELNQVREEYSNYSSSLNRAFMQDTSHLAQCSNNYAVNNINEAGYIEAAPINYTANNTNEVDSIEGGYIAFNQSANTFYTALSLGSSCVLYQRLVDAVASQNTSEYEQVMQRLALLSQLAERQELRLELLERLHKVDAKWAKAIAQHNAEYCKTLNASNVLEIWTWRNLKVRLEDLAALSNTNLQLECQRLSVEYRLATAKFAEAQAWLKMLSRLSGEHTRALNTAAQLINKLKTHKSSSKLTVRDIERQRDLKRCLSKVMTAIPVWIMPLQNVFENFEVDSRKFDVLIVDEASQVPLYGTAALFLAKKCIIVGDNKQVTPRKTVGISLDVLESVKRQYAQDLDNMSIYDMSNSLYDFAAVCYSTIMLREHFRCVPDIINFCNQLFYNNKIKVLRDCSSSQLLPALVNYSVPEKVNFGPLMNDVGNHFEALHVVALLKSCMRMPEYQNKTFGVIVMTGKKQLDFIENLIMQHISSRDQATFKLRCGKPSDFQGDERDVIFISMVDAQGLGVQYQNKTLTLKSFDKIDNCQDYNVAVSRAKDQLWIVSTLDKERELKANDVRKLLMTYAQNPDGGLEDKSDFLAIAEQRAESPFEAEVAAALLESGYKIYQQYHVGCYRIDIVVGYKNHKMAVECDGAAYHSSYEQVRYDLARQTILERLGWQFVRISGLRYYRNKEQTMREVFAQLDNLGIYPELSSLESEHSETDHATYDHAVDHAPAHAASNHTDAKLGLAVLSQPVSASGSEHIKNSASNLGHTQLDDINSPVAQTQLDDVSSALEKNELVVPAADIRPEEQVLRYCQHVTPLVQTVCHTAHDIITEWQDEQWIKYYHLNEQSQDEDSQDELSDSQLQPELNEERLSTEHVTLPLKNTDAERESAKLSYTQPNQAQLGYDQPQLPPLGYVDDKSDKATQDLDHPAIPLVTQSAQDVGHLVDHADNADNAQAAIQFATEQIQDVGQTADPNYRPSMVDTLVGFANEECSSGRLRRVEEHKWIEAQVEDAHDNDELHVAQDNHESYNYESNATWNNLESSDNYDSVLGTSKETEDLSFDRQSQASHSQDLAIQAVQEVYETIPSANFLKHTTSKDLGNTLNQKSGNTVSPDSKQTASQTLEQSVSQKTMYSAQPQTAHDKTQVFETSSAMWNGMLHLLSNADAVQKQSMLRRMDFTKHPAQLAAPQNEAMHDAMQDVQPDTKNEAQLNSLQNQHQNYQPETNFEPALELAVTLPSKHEIAHIPNLEQLAIVVEEQSTMVEEQSSAIKELVTTFEGPRNVAEERTEKQHDINQLNTQGTMPQDTLSQYTLYGSQVSQLNHVLSQQIENASCQTDLASENLATDKLGTEHSNFTAEKSETAENSANAKSGVSAETSVTAENSVNVETGITAESGGELSAAVVLSQEFLNAGYMRHFLLNQSQVSKIQNYSPEKLQKLAQTEQLNLSFCNGEIYADDEHLDVQALNQEEQKALASYQNKLNNITKQPQNCLVVENNVAREALLKIAIDKSQILKLHYLESSGLMFKILNESLDGEQVFLINVRPRSFVAAISKYRAWRKLNPSSSHEKKAAAAKKGAKNKSKSKSSSSSSKTKSASSGSKTKSSSSSSRTRSSSGASKTKSSSSRSKSKSLSTASKTKSTVKSKSTS